MIGLLTYDVPHRKTYDVLCLLKAKGYDDVIVFAKPHHYQKTFQPLIEHRPPCTNQIPPEELCRRFGYRYCAGLDETGLAPKTKILICGAGIVEQSVINRHILLNAHPGYLPNVRGLDALKWAILEEKPIGVTTHQLGDEVDAGLMIDRKLVPIKPYDTFHAVAQRQYEMEVNMLVEAIEKVDTATAHITPGQHELKRRMPHDLEKQLLPQFDKLVAKAAKV